MVTCFRGWQMMAGDGECSHLILGPTPWPSLPSLPSLPSCPTTSPSVLPGRDPGGEEEDEKEERENEEREEEEEEE